MKQMDGISVSGDSGPPGTPGSGGECAGSSIASSSGGSSGGDGNVKQSQPKSFQPTKSSERIRAKRLNSSSSKWSHMIAAVKSGRESSDYDPPPSVTPSSVPSSINEDTMPDGLMNESDPEDADSNPPWQLYEAVRSYVNASGVTISDPFMRLPNRRFYPDYYQEIEHPMSLSKIKSKIKTGSYRNTHEVIADMNIMFENAKKYNRPDSKIFKDACKLQKIMQSKAKELVNSPGGQSDSDESDNTSSCSGVGVGVKRPAGLRKRALANELKKARRSSQETEPLLKKRMQTLYKTLLDYVDESSRSPIAIFMEKPSRIDYPDYYDIIDNPIDMKTIESNIRNDMYSSEESLISDFQQMFENCKHYNEEGSQIYRDAELLETILMDKLAELGPYVPNKTRKARTRVPNAVQQRLKTLYDAVINYTDPKTNRQLSTIFMKLPSKLDYPDYYEVIKRPLDLEKIGTKLKNNAYESLEDLLSDLVLVFDNACKFNEPDSQLYKDALALQQIALQTKLELAENDSKIPDIKGIVQDLLTNLFISVYNHQDEEMRCYSDSILEYCEQESKNNSLNGGKLLNLDQIKRNLDRKRYRRLDRFQQDMFKVFERTRQNSRSDSQAFEDSIELQLHFIRLRNELCKNGEVLHSSASNFTEAHLMTQIETLKAEKLLSEQQEKDVEMNSDELKPEEKASESDPAPSNLAESLTEVSLNDQVYKEGDFVYIVPREANKDPHIINISKLWRDPAGQIWIYGCWFYRPYETYHLASKKFLEKEVFKSDSYNNAPLTQVVGKCFIMFVKDYFKFKPEGFDDRDVYVCESRYFTRNKTFKKIKHWPFSQDYSIVQRESPLPMVRIPSIFKDSKQEKLKDELMEEDEEDGNCDILDIDRPNVALESKEAEGEEGNTYYSQFSITSGSFKTGDCCYVRTDSGKNLICRIDKMWVDKEGNAFFHGPWFVQPRELPPLTPRMFYTQEVFLSSIEDTNPLLSICGKCAVMDIRDYSTKRPTEIPEQDIFVCELKYLEQERKFSKLPLNCMKKVNTSKTGVVEDEFYFFRKPLVITRTENGSDGSTVARKTYHQTDAPSPLPSSRPSIDTENEESNSSFVPNETPVVTPQIPRKKISKRLVTGYILYASEIRKSVVAANPECNFGEISRIIGTEWKNLPTDTKQGYELRATKQNEESAKEAARLAETLEAFPNSPSDGGIYECFWEGKCNFQCEDSQDLYDHLNSEPNGHVWRSYGDVKDKDEAVFQCLFAGCGRVKKGAAPFPSLARLIRHCKEVHVTKQQPKLIHPDNRSKNFTPGRKSLALGSNNLASMRASPQTPLTTHTTARSTPPPILSFFDNSDSTIAVSHPGTSNGIIDQAMQDPSSNSSWPQTTNDHANSSKPLFVPPPTRPNRLLHTTTFIKYIEQLRPDSKHIGNWEAQLTTNSENTTVPDKNKLPAHWLANGEGSHGSVVNALWALRNYMFQDALNLSRVDRS